MRVLLAILFKYYIFSVEKSKPHQIIKPQGFKHFMHSMRKTLFMCKKFLTADLFIICCICSVKQWGTQHSSQDLCGLQNMSYR